MVVVRGVCVGSGAKGGHAHAARRFPRVHAALCRLQHGEARAVVRRRPHQRELLHRCGGCPHHRSVVHHVGLCAHAQKLRPGRELRGCGARARGEGLLEHGKGRLLVGSAAVGGGVGGRGRRRGGRGRSRGGARRQQGEHARGGARAHKVAAVRVHVKRRGGGEKTRGGAAAGRRQRILCPQPAHPGGRERGPAVGAAGRWRRRGQGARAAARCKGQGANRPRRARLLKLPGAGRGQRLHVRARFRDEQGRHGCPGGGGVFGWVEEHVARGGRRGARRRKVPSDVALRGLRRLAALGRNVASNARQKLAQRAGGAAVRGGAGARRAQGGGSKNIVHGRAAAAAAAAV